MWIQCDYSQVVGEVKERNRLFKALTEIRELALLDSDKDIAVKLKEEFKLIAQKYDDALNRVMPTNN